MEKSIMKKLFSKLRRSPKRISAFVAILAAAIIIPTAVFAWGPSRDTYTTLNPADHVTFNSITDNPSYGDERNFVTIKDASNAGSGGWTDDINVENDKEYYVRAYVHNNAAADLNLVAENVMTNFNLPEYSAKRIQIDGYISADNSTPGQIWDQAVFSSDTKFSLDYIEGSAKYINNVFTDGTPLSDEIIGNGVKLGYESMNGEIPGCFQYTGYVIFKVKALTAEFEVEKTVRINGDEDKTFKENVSVEPGDKVDFQIYFENAGGTELKNVVVKDSLPTGMTYVTDSTYLYNGNGQRQVADGVTGGGIVIGGYLPNANAYVKFTAKVSEGQALECGINNLVNTVKVTTDKGSKEDDATVTVNKDCAEEKECKPGIPVGDPRCYELPKTGPGDTLATIVGVGILTASAGYYINSRRNLSAK